MSKKIATKSKGVSQSKNAQPKDKTQKILIIATVVTVIVAALAIILSVALANRGPAEDATLAELKTNGFGFCNDCEHYECGEDFIGICVCREKRKNE